MGKEITRVMFPYEDIIFGEGFNGRKTFDDIPELAASLDENGLLQPILIREGGPSRTDGKRKAFLVVGERRYRAIGLLRNADWCPPPENGKKRQRKRPASYWNQVEVKFVKGNSQEMANLMMTENFQRKNLPPLEEAQRMFDYMEEFKMNQAQFALKFTVSEPFVSQRLALLHSTTPEVREAIENKTLTATQAREMVTLPAVQQKEVLREIEEQQRKGGKKISVAEVKEKTDKRKSELGIKRTRGDSKKSKDSVSYDEEKMTLAKELFEGKNISMRPKSALMEQIGALIQRAKRPNVSDTTKVSTKAQIALAEWVLGARDALP